MKNFKILQNDNLIDPSNIEGAYDRVFMKNKKTISSGIHYLDQLMGGMFNVGDLIICAARPGVGKTTFAINAIANNIDDLNESSKKVLYITPDMSSKYLYYRLISCVYDISISDLMSYDKDHILEYIRQFPLKVTETYSYEKIEEYIKIYSDEISVVIIDYIQVIRSADPKIKGANRSEQIGIMTIELKRLAKKYGLTLLFLAQLNRESEKDSKAWIKDSGYLEQEADVIIILNSDDTQRYPRLLIDVIKNRHGATGKCIQNMNVSRFRIE